MIDYNDRDIMEIEILIKEKEKAYRKYQREQRKYKKLREAQKNGEPVTLKELLEQNDRAIDAMNIWIDLIPSSSAPDHEKIPKVKEPRNSTRKKKEVV